MCPELALYALNPHFSGRTSTIRVKRGQAYSILGVFFFVSLAFFDFLAFFGVSFVNLSLETLRTLLFIFFLSPVYLIFSYTRVVVFSRHF